MSEVTGLRAKVADLTSKLSKASAAEAVGGAKKKSVSFAVAAPSSDKGELNLDHKLKVNS